MFENNLERRGSVFTRNKFVTAFAISAIAAIIWGCGQLISPTSPGTPTNPTDPNCKPVAVADAGGDIFFSPDPSQAKFAKIGTEPLDGMSYEWSPSMGLDDPRVAQPVVSAPAETVLYTLTVKTKCNVAVAHMRAVMLKEFRSGFDTVKAFNNKGEEQEYPTGYNPSFFSRYRAQFLHMPAEGISKSRTLSFTPEFNQTPPSFHTNRQPNGSCWAEGARSCAEAALFYVTGKSIHVSTQRIIDCSGFGTASGGGQIAIDDFLAPKGVVYEVDYPYTGRDGRCKKDVPFHEQSKHNYFITNANGDDPEWDDIKHALVEYGSGEICGSASSLRDGGWVSNPGNGGTNHCYAANGWFQGSLHGKEAGEYLIVQNSWGGDWGENGQGFYRIAPDGKKIRSSVMTENKFPSFGTPCPPPVVDGGPDRTIKLIPGSPNVVKIGTLALPDQTYSWTPADSLATPSTAQTLAWPKKTTEYMVTATKVATAQCPAISAHAKVTVHVYRDESHDQVVEVIE